MTRASAVAEQLRLAENALAAGRFDEAADLLRTATRLDRDSPRPRFMLAYALSRSGKAEEAILVLRRLLERFPANSDAWFNLGNLLRAERRLEESAHAFRRAAALQPENPAHCINLSYVLAHLGRMNEAEEAARSCLLKFPREPDLLLNLAQILRVKRQWDEALAALDSCVAMAPGRSPYRVTLAMVLTEAGDIDRAKSELQAVLEQEPDCAEAHMQLAHIYLSQCRFAAGWQEYQWRESRLRWLGAQAKPGKDRCSFQVEALRGRDVVVCGEQGLGDVLMFLRFVPTLRSVARGVFAEIDPRLHAILPPDLVQGFSPPDGALRVLVGDLPALEAAIEAPPPPPVRLVAEPLRAELFRNRLKQLGSPPYVGVSWEAGFPWEKMSRPGGGLFKRIEPAALGAALESAPGTLLSLQRAPKGSDVEAIRRAAHRAVHDFSWVNDDLSDAVALLAVLDDYVAVSNTNVHFAAGLRKPARVMVTSPAEWRWTFAEERSPWFPEAILYREDRGGGWDSALGRLQRDLQVGNRQ